ncbi:MAG: glucose-1-phosphate cytidylyltransferase [Proteobacteria bacterium]|nr:glucose-1-phosphate cytidylyltransferase [Pseudomonadota bacterium]
MKVVLFCGGQGTRLRDQSAVLPKPLITIGDRPILWHLMRYYAHFGHTEFILCLGYQGRQISDYFLRYDECRFNDFTLDGGRRDLHSTDVSGWNIHCLDTGLNSNIGQRLLRVRELLEDQPMFLANYADGLSDVPLDRVIERFAGGNSVATFAAVQRPRPVPAIQCDTAGYVSSIAVPHDSRINGGFFVLRPEIFAYINEGEELVEQPFARLVSEARLTAYRHDGFWQSMDTFADKIIFDRMAAQGNCPWAVWRA